MLQERLSCLKNQVHALSYQNRPIIIWGMGEYASFVTQTLGMTENLKIEAFTDEFSGEGTERFAGVKTIEASMCRAFENPLVLICVKNPAIVKRISLFLERMEVEYITFDEFIVGKNYEEVMNAISLCADKQSEYIYTELLRRRIDNCFNCRDLALPDIYFALPHFMEEDFDEVYVDLGAFVGDTLENFLFRRLTSFKTYYAFEPDKKNYRAMQCRIDRLEKEWNMPQGKIEPICSAVGAKNGSFLFSESGSVKAALSVKDEGSMISVVTLDEFFKDKKISTIKADIESSEYPMLLGAKEVLQRDRPKLAVSIYHSILDFYNIMNWVDGLNLGYKFWIRHHGTKLGDTVMYAVCE